MCLSVLTSPVSSWNNASLGSSNNDSQKKTNFRNRSFSVLSVGVGEGGEREREALLPVL